MSKVKNKYDEYGNVIATTTSDLINAKNEAYEQLRKQTEALEQQKLEATQQNIKTVADYLNEGYDAEKAMLMAARNDAVNAQAEAKEQVDADNRAARWTGLTELAASIANLVGVGEGKATSQQYRQYSQDWMKKADNDMRYHRARIDNLRERQRAIQQRVNQMKINNNLTLAQMQAAAQKERFEAQQRLADAEAAHALDIAGMDAESKRAQAKLAVEGEEKQAHLDIQQSHAAQGRERLRMAKDDDTLAKIAQGYVPDKTAPGGFRYDPKEKYNIDVTSSRQGKEGKDTVRDSFNDGENRVPIYWSKEERQRFIDKAYAMLTDIPGFADDYEEAKTDSARNGVILKYAPQSAQLKEELYEYSSPAGARAQRSGQVEDEVANFFNS